MNDKSTRPSGRDSQGLSPGVAGEGSQAAGVLRMTAVFGPEVDEGLILVRRRLSAMCETPTTLAGVPVGRSARDEDRLARRPLA